jgi:hypothetical protein
MAAVTFRAFPGLSKHRAPLGRLDLLAAMAINIRPLRGQRPSLPALTGAKTLATRPYGGKDPRYPPLRGQRPSLPALTGAKTLAIRPLWGQRPSLSAPYGGEDPPCGPVWALSESHCPRGHSSKVRQAAASPVASASVFGIPLRCLRPVARSCRTKRWRLSRD